MCAFSWSKHVLSQSLLIKKINFQCNAMSYTNTGSMLMFLMHYIIHICESYITKVLDNLCKKRQNDFLLFTFSVIISSKVPKFATKSHSGKVWMNYLWQEAVLSRAGTFCCVSCSCREWARAMSVRFALLLQVQSIFQVFRMSQQPTKTC